MVVVVVVGGVAHLLRLDEFELHAAARPGDEVAVGGVVQQGDQELPELQGAAALVWRPVAVHQRFLLYFTYGAEREREREGERERARWRGRKRGVSEHCSLPQPHCGETFLAACDCEVARLLILHSRATAIQSKEPSLLPMCNLIDLGLISLLYSILSN